MNRAANGFKGRAALSAARRTTNVTPRKLLPFQSGAVRTPPPYHVGPGLLAALAALAFAGCATQPGTIAPRKGDEIVLAGQFVHTGTRVVLWMDPGGYDAYRVERRFARFDESSWETSRVAVAALKTPNRFGLRQHVLTPEQIEQVRGGGWDLLLLQQVVDQFVIH